MQRSKELSREALEEFDPKVALAIPILARVIRAGRQSGVLHNPYDLNPMELQQLEAGLRQMWETFKDAIDESFPEG